MNKEPEPKSQTEHSPAKKAFIIGVGMVIGLVLLAIAMQAAMRGGG